MKHSNLGAVGVIVVLSMSLASAQVIPGRWEKVEALTPGTRIQVDIQSGDKIRGEFVFTTADGLGIDVPGQNRMTLPKNTVVRVTRFSEVKRQTLLGTLVGAGAGVGTGLAISAGFDETFFARQDLMAITCGAIGAAAGAAIGHAIKTGGREDVIYQSR